MSGKWKLDWPEGIESEFHEAIADSIEVLAIEIMHESQEVVPVETGDLQSSAYIKMDRKNLVCTMGYKAPHARLVHEKQQWKHEPEKRAKYLEYAFARHQNKLPSLIEKAINAASKKGKWLKAGAGELEAFSWSNYSRTAKGEGIIDSKRLRYALMHPDKPAAKLYWDTMRKRKGDKYQERMTKLYAHRVNNIPMPTFKLKKS